MLVVFLFQKRSADVPKAKRPGVLNLFEIAGPFGILPDSVVNAATKWQPQEAEPSTK